MLQNTNNISHNTCLAIPDHAYLKSNIFQWYANLRIDGHMKLVAEEPAQNLAIRAGGYMILMQEQDSFGNRLFNGI